MGIYVVVWRISEPFAKRAMIYLPFVKWLTTKPVINPIF